MDEWQTRVDAATAFAALALASGGRPTEGLVAVLHALAPHLQRYQRAVTAYADELLKPGQVEN